MTTPLAPYPSPDAREHRLETLAHAVGGSLVEYGRSLDGAPLRAVRIPSERGDAPRVLCTANIHGLELVAGQVAFGLLDALAREDAAVVGLRRRAELWVIPCLNPDGYRRTFEAGGRGRVSDFRPNAAGVDLNRNFPLPGPPSRLPTAGSDRPGNATYRGPSPLSEPETRALDELLRKHPMRASANVHSFMGTIIPARVTDRPTFAAYRALCRAFARGQARVRYWRLSSRIVDVWTGELEDHLHHAHGTWAACIETFSLLASLRQHLRAPSVFWRFNPHDPRPWIDNDVPGIAAFLEAALDRGSPVARTSPQTDS